MAKKTGKKQKRVVFVIPQQHFDPVWRKPKAQYMEWQYNFIGKFLNIARRHSNFTFTEGQACVMRNFFEVECPEQKPFLLKLIKEGRYEMVTGMEVIPDANLPSGESLVRTATIGKRYLREEFGVNVETGWYYDSFGMNAQTPQILKRAGFKWLHAIRFARKDVNPPCWWTGIDGTKILVHSKEYAHNSWEYASLDGALKVFQNLTNRTKFVLQGEKKGWEGTQPAYYDKTPEGKHWWYEPVSEEETPSWHIAECVERFNKEQDEIEFRFGVPRDYFQALEQEIRQGRKIPTYTGEMNPEFTGCYTTRHWLKQTNRRAEAAILAAENLATIACEFGKAYPAKNLLHAWRRLCYTHHHDGICACHIDVIENDLKRYYGEVLGITGSVIAGGLDVLARKADTRGPGQAVLLYNPLSWKRNDVAAVELDADPAPNGEDLAVVDSAGELLPAVKTRTADGKMAVEFVASGVPSMGYKVFHLVKGEKAKSAVRKSGNIIENEFYRVEATNKGIERIYDKQLRRDLIDSTVGFGNVLLAEQDTGDVYVGGFPGPKVDGYEAESRIVKVEANDLCATIRVKGRFPKLPWLEESKLLYEQEIRVYAGIKRVDFVTRIDWFGQQTRVSVKFPTPIRTDEGLYSIPYGAIRRKAYDPRPLQLDRDWPAQTWMGVDDGKFGITLLNDGTPGIRVLDGIVMMSLMRSPLIGGYLASPWPADQAKAHGKHEFRYALTSHEGDALESLGFRAGWEWKHKLLAMAAKSSAGTLPSEKSYLSVDAENVVITVMKHAEDEKQGLVIRAFEATGKPAKAQFSLPGSFKNIREVDMIEDDVPGAKPKQGDRLSVNFTGYDIRTFMFG